ncbi:MAG TPA: pteridine reductase [Steroidobacteraceae bacterium]|nr:pteridine reductase [Steroidobacteraceae bacterium]
MATMPLLSSRTALVTGAARRVGAAIATALHAAGANLVIHYRSSQSEAETLVERFNRARGASAVALRADLIDTAALPRLVDEAASAFGGLDILVNNASSFHPTPIGKITLDSWDDLIGSNLKAPLFLSQAAAPELRKRSGLILNLVDIHGMRPLPDYPLYSVAKAGFIMLTRALARELGPEIRVNGIAPGPVMWPEGEIDAAMKAEIIRKTALKRLGTPEDVAQAALFFATAAPFVTGQVLAIDGGRSLGW